MKFLHTTVIVALGWLATSATAHAAPPEVLRASMRLPAPWTSAFVKTASVSTDGARACIAGNNNWLTENPFGFLMLVDPTHSMIVWQAKISPPAHVASIEPVQCLIDSDRVYLLAHASASATREAQGLTYVAQFDMQGKQLAGRLVALEASNIFAYGITRSAGVLKVMGYTKEATPDTETYATYTVSFDEQLQQKKAPLIRKNGAYVQPATAQIVGDSMYVGGRFFKATVSTRDVGDFSASQLRVDGGYRWSQHTLPGNPRGVAVGTADDGTIFTIAREQQKTLLSVVRPDGKRTEPLDYSSRYCDTQQMTGYAGGILAIREPCRGGSAELVFIDPATGSERTVQSLKGVPLVIATHGDLAIAVSRDQSGNTSLQTMTPGDRQ
jgi:RNA polymerase subunit RPABC4/transcription elongation factor Spt4